MLVLTLPAWPGYAEVTTGPRAAVASDRAPARERPAPACVAGERRGHDRTACRSCERPSASEGAASTGLRGRRTQLRGGGLGGVDEAGPQRGDGPAGNHWAQSEHVGQGRFPVGL